ncbi:MAG: response regulator, partial [Gammaproteobacteria bacterium]
MNASETESGERPRILVVDDQPANLVAATTVLAPLPAQVMTASSGDEALALVLRHEFAVILLDVRMPVMDGYETATLIRGHTERNPVPIIFLTAEAPEPHAIAHGYDSGAVDYLLKPLDEDLLRSKVEVFLDLYRHKRTLLRATEALRAANERMARLLQVACDGIVGIDADDRVGFVNPAACRLLECTPEALLDRCASEIFFASAAERTAPLAEAAAHGVSRGSGVRVRTQRGSSITVDYTLTRADGNAGTPPSSFVLVFQPAAEQTLPLRIEVDRLTG